MKAKIFNINGKKTKEIELPGIFSQPVREDIVAKILESKKTRQPYAPSLVAGKQHAASPPKTIAMINISKINKKEMKIALASALSATTDRKIVASKYEKLTEKDIENLPLIVESKIVSLKTKEIISSLKKILGKKLFGIVSKKKKIRSGKGKLRGRKYKSNAGLLIVTGSNEKLKIKEIETKKVNNLSITDLAGGGLGRLTLYTENSIKEFAERLK